MKKPVLHRTTALCSASLFALGVACAAPALANPQGGVVAAGNASISANGNRLDIHQHTGNVVIDWRSFDIDPGEHTQFHQPSSASTALNRVNSTDPSTIAGKLSANGNVILVNPNGVFFEGTSQVDVNGLIATTADIDNQNFMDDNLIFDRPGNPNAKVVNHGSITAKQAGLVGLVAPQVENHGVIHAKLGKVQLASGDTFAVDMYGDGLVNISVSDTVASQLVRNTGTVTAEGGTIALTAAAGKDIVNSLISVEGELLAPSISHKGGTIVIGDAGSGKARGTVRVSGNVKADGSRAGEKGGKVTVTAQHVAVENSAVISADGDSGGGTIHIGGEYQGSGDTATANKTYIGSDVLISANATLDGGGGEVIVWADDWTKYHGDIQAQGGVLGGNGGFVETSGKKTLEVAGLVHVGARREDFDGGEWLLDPQNITIQDGADGAEVNITETAGPPDVFASNADDAIVTTDSIEAALNAGTSVTIQTSAGGTQDGNITIANQIERTSGAASTPTLTLNAHNDIIINAAIRASAGVGQGLGVVLIADSDNDGSGNVELTAGEINVRRGGDVTFSDTIENIILNKNFTIRHDEGTADFGSNTIQFNGFKLANEGKNIVMNGDLVGAGSYSLRLRGSTSLGLGDAQAGDIQLSDATLDQINELDSATFRGTTVNLGARNWTQTLSLIASNLNVNGDQNFGNSAVTLEVTDIAINNNLTGTGTLYFEGIGAVGDNASSTLITDAELANITDGWSQITFNSDNRDLEIAPDSYEFTDPIVFRTNQNEHIYVNDAILAAAGSDAAFSFAGQATGQTTDLTINDIIDTSAASGSSDILFNDSVNNVNIGAGLTTNGGDITFNSVGTHTVSSSIELDAKGGTINSTGLSTGTNGLTLTANNFNITGAVTGTGSLVLQEGVAGTTIGIGSGAGTLSITDALLANFTGWSSYVFGNFNGTDGTSGDIEVNTAYDFGDADIIITSGADIDLAGTLTKASGTGTVNYGFEADGNITNSNNSDIVITDNGAAGLSDDGTINLRINSDFDADQDGNVRLSGTNIVTNGGSLIIGGGLTPQTGFAYGEYGVDLSSSSIVTDGGNVWMNGYSQSTVANKHGIRMLNSHISSGAGNITINVHNASTGTASNNHGLVMNAASSQTYLDTTSGDITISASNDVNHNSATGIVLSNGADMYTDSGSITLNADIAGTGNAIDLRSNSEIGDGATTGNITLVTDSLSMLSTDSIQTSATLTIEERTDGKTINIGTDNGGDLVIDDANLANLSAGAYRFGGVDGSGGTSGNLEIDTAYDFGASDIIFLSGGDITLNSDLATTSANANALVLSANANFINTAGADALTATNSRWIVYSAGPTGNTRDELLPDASEFNKRYATDAPGTIGANNRFVYATATQPVITYDVDDDNVTEGDSYTGFGISYTSGLLTGDTLSNIGLTGDAAFSTTYTDSDAAGTYAGALTATSGTLSNPLGYQFAFNAGDLTVDEPPAAPPAPAPGIEPVVEDILPEEPELVIETPEEPEVAEPTDAANNDGGEPTEPVTETQTTDNANTGDTPANGVIIPTTFEVVSQNISVVQPTLHAPQAPVIGASGGGAPVVSASSNSDTGSTTSTGASQQSSSQEDGETDTNHTLANNAKPKQILGGLITVHPGLVKLLGLDESNIF